METRGVLLQPLCNMCGERYAEWSRIRTGGAGLSTALSRSNKDRIPYKEKTTSVRTKNEGARSHIKHLMSSPALALNVSCKSTDASDTPDMAAKTPNNVHLHTLFLRETKLQSIPLRLFFFVVTETVIGHLCCYAPSHGEQWTAP